MVLKTRVAVNTGGLSPRTFQVCQTILSNGKNAANGSGERCGGKRRYGLDEDHG
jgi:hypothetical protein